MESLWRGACENKPQRSSQTSEVCRLARGADFVGDDTQATTDGAVVAGIIHAQTFVPVAPFARQAGEEVVTGHDQDAASLQALI